MTYPESSGFCVDRSSRVGSGCPSGELLISGPYVRAGLKASRRVDMIELELLLQQPSLKTSQAIIDVLKG